jgi:arginine-tRNA-protein transferase
MALLLHHEIEPPRPCSYLALESASLEQMLLQDVSAEELEAMLARGWRRFGATYFRPSCAPCNACVSLRVPTATFHPSRSQRRARNRCARFRLELGPPRVDDARLSLYAAWHAFREGSRDWEPSPLTDRDYAFQFAFPHPCARELTWWDDETEGGPRLVAVGYADETPHAWSAVYFFYAPDIAPLSPGTANVVFQLELARTRGIPHVYLGYRVRGCPSLRYKEAFGPHELLDTRPGFRQAPLWVPVPPPEGPARAEGFLRHFCGSGPPRSLSPLGRCRPRSLDLAPHGLHEDSSRLGRSLGPPFFEGATHARAPRKRSARQAPQRVR